MGKLSFGAPITHVYNPLEYAQVPHELYLERFGAGRKRVVFLGMNPGPFGMAQTGVPFGEIPAVRDWLKICAAVGKPAKEHPKRLITGFDCERSEVSGRRLWGLFAQRFGAPEKFFAEHFVSNYCPLVFCEESGRNFTPDKLPAAEQAKLFAACDEHLRRVVEILEPEWLIGVGGFAQKRAEAVAERINGVTTSQSHKQKSQFDPYSHESAIKGSSHPSPSIPMASQARHESVSLDESCASRKVVPVEGRGKPYKLNVGVVLHPSPASPAANRGDWGKTVTGQLVAMGVWR